MSKVRVAVIGYGHLGKWHCQKVEAHREVADFVAIVESFPSSQELAKKNHPQVKVVSSISEVIHEIDAAFVVTPTSTHFEMVKYLVDQSKHVFCEKPLCSNDEEALKILDLLRGKKLVLQVGHSERFHSAWDVLTEKFKSLKPPYQIRMNRVAAFKGRATDVDVIQDLAIHDLDLMMFLFSQKPLNISTNALKIRTNNYDHASIIIELENNCSAQITVSRNHVKEIRDLEVTSSQGMIYVDLMNSKIHEASSSNFEDGCFVREFSYEKRDHLLLEHKAFYQSIVENKPAIVTVQDGVRAVHLVDRCLKSAREKGIASVNFYA